MALSPTHGKERKPWEAPSPEEHARIRAAKAERRQLRRAMAHNRQFPARPVKLDPPDTLPVVETVVTERDLEAAKEAPAPRPTTVKKGTTAPSAK